MVIEHLGCYLIKRRQGEVTLYGPRSSAQSLLHALETAATSVDSDGALDRGRMFPGSENHRQIVSLPETLSHGQSSTNTVIRLPRGKPAFNQDPHRVREITERNLEAAIGREVRNFRRQQGMTVADLAAVTGLSIGMLSKIENGNTSPSLTTLQVLSATPFRCRSPLSSAATKNAARPST